MARLKWNQTGEKFFETGVSNGVLYVFNTNSKSYGTGVAWNGLTAVTESPSGAESTSLYADNIKYLNLVSAEEFGGTIEAYTYPTEFMECDGSVEVVPGLYIGQQARKTFGMVYKTIHGTDTDPEAYYKLHIIYGALAAPSEKAYATVNDSPEAITFSWEFSTTPVAFTEDANKAYKPVSVITLNSKDFTTVSDGAVTINENFKALENYLFGCDADSTNSVEAIEPTLPTPDQVINLIKTGKLTGEAAA